MEQETVLKNQSSYPLHQQALPATQREEKVKDRSYSLWQQGGGGDWTSEDDVKNWGSLIIFSLRKVTIMEWRPPWRIGWVCCWRSGSPHRRPWTLTCSLLFVHYALSISCGLWPSQCRGLWAFLCTLCYFSGIYTLQAFVDLHWAHCQTWKRTKLSSESLQNSCWTNSLQS